MVCFSLGKLVVVSLDKLPMLVDAVIVSSNADRLAELGFVVGATVRVSGRAAFGGPIAVRINSDCFAFKPFEVETMAIPKPPNTRGISAEPEYLRKPGREIRVNERIAGDLV